jgi:hypothetical protein
MPRLSVIVASFVIHKPVVTTVRHPPTAGTTYALFAVMSTLGHVVQPPDLRHLLTGTLSTSPDGARHITTVLASYAEPILVCACP